MRRRALFPYKDFYPFQEEFFRGMETHQFGMLVWARRAGKDICCWTYMVHKALQKRGNYAYIAPTQDQVKDIIWDGMTHDGIPYLSIVPKRALKKMMYLDIFLKNGSKIAFYGCERSKGLRLQGQNFSGVVFSEFQDVSEEVWALVQPSLVKTGGWAVLNGRPHGMNHFYTMWNSVNEDTWYKSFVKGNQYLTEVEIKRIRIDSAMSDANFRREYECDWHTEVESSIFGHLLQGIELSHGLLDKKNEIYISFDLGISVTSIWVAQLAGNNYINFVKFKEDSGKDIWYYIDYIKNLKCTIGAIFLPHDADNRNMLTGVTNYVALGREFNSVVMLPRSGLKEGIRRVTTFLSRARIRWDNDVDFGVEQLKLYRANKGSEGVVHEDSDCADSFRYMVTGLHLMGYLGF